MSFIDLISDIAYNEGTNESNVPDVTDAERQLLILIADLMLAIQPPGYVSLQQITRLREQVNRVRGTLNPVVIEVEDQSG